MDENDEKYDFGALAALLRRRAALIAGLALVLAVASAATALNNEERYTSTSVVLFRDAGLGPQVLGRANLLGGQQLFDADTNVGLASLDVVSERASERLAREGATSVADASDVEVREGAGPELVEITATTERAADATVVANAYAEAFIELRREADRAGFEVARSVITDQLEAGAGELGPRLTAQLRTQLADLGALERLQVGNIELVERAEQATKAIGASPVRNAALGGFAGLVVGLAVALMLERVSPRLRSRRDYERAFSAPVVGTLAREDLADLASTTFQEPLTRLRFSGGQRRSGAWLVTSALDAGIDHGAIALGLALAAADGGQRVGVVEAELAAPKVARRLGVEAAPGLADLLADAADGPSVRRTVDSPGRAAPITVIPAGLPQANPAALLADGRIGDLLTALADENDLVIVSGPRIGQGAEIVPLGVAVDGIVLVTSDGSAAAEVELVQDELGRLPATLLGVVIAAGSESSARLLG